MAGGEGLSFLLQPSFFDKIKDPEKMPGPFAVLNLFSVQLP